jgi:hypothetical protein
MNEFERRRWSVGTKERSHKALKLFILRHIEAEILFVEVRVNGFVWRIFLGKIFMEN